MWLSKTDPQFSEDKTHTQNLAQMLQLSSTQKHFSVLGVGPSTQSLLNMCVWNSFRGSIYCNYIKFDLHILTLITESIACINIPMPFLSKKRWETISMIQFFKQELDTCPEVKYDSLHPQLVPCPFPFNQRVIRIIISTIHLSELTPDPVKTH